MTVGKHVNPPTKEFNDMVGVNDSSIEIDLRELSCLPGPGSIGMTKTSFKSTIPRPRIE